MRGVRCRNTVLHSTLLLLPAVAVSIPIPPVSSPIPVPTVARRFLVVVSRQEGNGADPPRRETPSRLLGQVEVHYMVTF